MGYRLISTALHGRFCCPGEAAASAGHRGDPVPHSRGCQPPRLGHGGRARVCARAWWDRLGRRRRPGKQSTEVAPACHGGCSHVHSILLRLAPFGRSRRGCGGTLRWTSQKRYVVFACRLPLHAAIIPLAAVSPLWWTSYCRCMLCSLPDPAVDNPCAERQHRRASSLDSNAPQIPLSVCRLISGPI